MVFSLVQTILAHPTPDGALHFHLWHVAAITGALLCALLFMGVAILDLRKALREERATREKAEREAAMRASAASRVRTQLEEIGAELTALAEDLPGIDVRFKAASIIIGRHGRKLTLVARLVAETQERAGPPHAETDEMRRQLDRVNRRNVENARTLAEAHEVMQVRERALDARAKAVTQANDANRDNAERLAAAVEENERTRESLEEGVQRLTEAGELAATVADPKKTLH